MAETFFSGVRFFEFFKSIKDPAFTVYQRAGALDKLKQKSVWHVRPNQVEGMLQAVFIRM